MSTDTLDLTSRAAWTNADAVDAYRDRRLAEAEQLDREIQSLVESEGQSRYQICLRLGRMRREELWKVLNKRSFVRYAIDVRAAGSSREARQWADVADRLPDLPELHAVFASGKASPSVIREMAPAATRETDAELARQAVHMTVEQARNAVKRLRGEAPTSRVSAELPLEAKALLVDVVIGTLSERLGRPVSMAEALVHLIEQFVAEPTDGTAEAHAARRPPSRRAQVHTGKCMVCKTHQLRGSEGWVALSPASAAMIECDAEVVDEQGKIVRTISERIRRLVFERHGMACAVPGCGATRGLHFHHEAPAGWRGVGEDPEHILVLCGAHHRQRHEGWLTIQGSASTGFRFRGHGGAEIVAPTTGAPMVGAHVGSPGSSDVDAVADAHVGTPDTSDVDAVAEAALRALELSKTAARAAIQRVRSRAAGPLTVEELVTLALRG